MQLLQGKVALISGGSKGIGAAIVRSFAAHGAAVAFTYRHSAEQAQSLVQELENQGFKVKAYASNAADFEQTQTLVAEVAKDFTRVDVLVNNAGITRDNLLLRLSEAQWDEVLQNNLKSVFNFSKAVSRLMLKQKGGSIINIGSIVGLTGNAGQANYAAAKAGMVGFSKSLAQELGSRQIRCNVLAPGFVQTDMTDALAAELQEKMLANIPLARFAKAEEIASVALFLASDLSAYVTGEVLTVAGGLR